MFDVPDESPHPLFIQVDFGLVKIGDEYEPRLVEIQGFPSIYMLQPTLAQAYIETYDLDNQLRFLLGGLEFQDYIELLRKAVVGACDPENVILMEIEPLRQKTLPDFLLTEELLGVKAVSITDIEKDGRKLYSEQAREGSRSGGSITARLSTNLSARA